MKFKYLLIVCVVGAIACNNASVTDEAKTKVSAILEEVKPDSLLRHVVMFKFLDTATPEQVKVVEDAFHELPKKIDAIHDYEWGINNSPEGLNKGLTHCFLVTFKSEADRQIYLPHPDHQAFVEVLKPVLDDVAVIDYWVK